MERYEVCEQLGKGGMGTAYKCKLKGDHSTRFLAIKQVACEGTHDGNKALREAKMLQGIQHTNVVAYVDVFLNMDKGLLQVCTVMEFCANGDLAAHLGRRKGSGERVPERTAANWMYQIADALCYLHSRKIVHRDLKPANVFLDEVSPANMALKVGDFGLSATLEAGKRSSRVGTPCYLAPEILFSEQYGEAVDVWSAGCIFWEILTLDFLWQRRGCLGMVVQTEPMKPQLMPADIAYDLREVVCACLQFSGDRRPNSRDLSAAILNFQEGGSLDASIPGDRDIIRQVGSFFESAIGGLFGGEKAGQRPVMQQQSTTSSANISYDGVSAENFRSQTLTDEKAGEQYQRQLSMRPSQPKTPPGKADKKGLRWHSDSSIAEIKEI